MRSHLTNLPPEVLSAVFSHLRPRALRQCLLVNSAFNTLARPHLFRYIAAFGDEAEPCFFLLHDNAILEAVAVIGDIDEDQPIPKDLSYMRLFAHAHCCNREREPFSSPTGSPFISSCRVLNVHLALPDDEDTYPARMLTISTQDGGLPIDPWKDHTCSPCNVTFCTTLSKTPESTSSCSAMCL